MNRCVIIGGAEIRNYPFVRAQLRKDDFCIFCDSGLSHREALQAKPDLIVGDFDSHARPRLPVETIVLPREKDDPDTVFAVKEALSRGFEEFLLMGAVAGRLDHSLANVSILLLLHSLGKKGYLVDDYSIMEIVGKEPVTIYDACEFFSLLNISGKAAGITVQNAKYPLTNAEIDCTYQYGVSNEVLPGKRVTVRVEEGNLLLIRIQPQSKR